MYSILLIGGFMILEVVSNLIEKHVIKITGNLMHPYSGNIGDVAMIGTNLDIGDISCTIDDINRLSELKNTFGLFNDNNTEIELFIKKQKLDFDKLLSCASSGIPIRVWKSNAPFSMCSFYYVCYLLKDISCNLSVISLPEFQSITNDSGVIHNGWHEVESNSLCNYLHLEEQIPNNIKAYYAHLWGKLIIENSPLRAVINGNIVSVPIDFYDHIIIKNIPNSEFLMSDLIGNLIGRYQLKVHDMWYAFRIECMIKENKLVTISNVDKLYSYRKILKKM